MWQVHKNSICIYFKMSVVPLLCSVHNAKSQVCGEISAQLYILTKSKSWWHQVRQKGLCTFQCFKFLTEGFLLITVTKKSFDRYIFGAWWPLLRINKSQNKIVEPQILQNNEQTNLFFYSVRIKKKLWENLRLKNIVSRTTELYLTTIYIFAFYS